MPSSTTRVNLNELSLLEEHIQADIWVRLQRSLGNDVVFICEDDAHGIPIMISAEKQNITPNELVAKFMKWNKKFVLI